MQELVDLADVSAVSGHICDTCRHKIRYSYRGGVIDAVLCHVCNGFVSIPDKCSSHDTWNRVLGKDQKKLFGDD